MARQSNKAVEFQRSIRKDEGVLMSSARAGKMIPVGYVPIFRGDSAAGRVGVDVELAEMPKPLLNAVGLNVQAWFVPKAAHPQFSGYDEFSHSYNGTDIKALGEADRTPPAFFEQHPVGVNFDTLEMVKTLGMHCPDGQGQINSDVADAYSLIWNFRAAAHSSRIARRQYRAESTNPDAYTADRAFWPSHRFSGVVPDYEQALVLGNLDLDVVAGSVPVTGIAKVDHLYEDSTGTVTNTSVSSVGSSPGPVAGDEFRALYHEVTGTPVTPEVDAGGNYTGDLTGQTIGVTLADIDKARTTQSFAKLRTAYAGNDATGFDNDDVIVADLMRGIQVPMEAFKRPMLLDSKRVSFGMVERFATDAANLDASVSQGVASALLSINLPKQDVGGMIMFVVEVLPERIFERQEDPWFYVLSPTDLPDALRDIQRTEPVDTVANRRIDARHTAPDALYGYEPMNSKWQRSFTRLGGKFFQDDPAAPTNESRSAIWQPQIVDPAFTDDHWLAPDPFPHDVFSDTTGDAFEIVCRHDVTISGLTQFGDVLLEDNGEYAATET